MKVLFLSQIVPYPPHGGVLQRGYNLIREITQSAEVHLLAFVHPDELPDSQAVAEGRTVLEQMCRSVEFFTLWPKRSRAHRLAALGVAGLSRRPFSVIAHRSTRFRQRVNALLASSTFDVVHVDTLALAPYTHYFRIPSVLTHHNIESVLMRRRSEAERSALARAYLRREARKLAACETAVAGRFDVNVVVSDTDGEVLRALCPRARVAVVPNGVDTAYFSPGLEPEEASVIYVGGMNMFANRDAVMHFATRIWPAVLAQLPAARFIAVGQDPPSELLAMAESDPRVVATGRVPDIRPLVRGAGVFVVPLRVGGGTRLKVLDAMAMGKAIVSTSIGCEGIGLHPGVHALIEDDPQAFAAATVSLLRDCERRKQLGRAARQLVERSYAWPIVGRHLLDAYRTAIRTAGRSA